MLESIPLFDIGPSTPRAPEIELITSISYDSDELIASILQLHVPDHLIDCDPTYSSGVFYSGIIPAPKYKFDLNPKSSGVVQADCRHLPLDDNSLGCIMFDPPIFGY